MSVDSSNSNSNPAPLIGELFVEAGVVNPKAVMDCLFTSIHSKLPLGKVLVMAGHIREDDVDRALETQSLIRSGRFDKQMATRVIRRSCTQNVSLEQARELEHCDRVYATPCSQLGKLLLAARVASESVILQATRLTSQSNPLGKLLLSQGVIERKVLIAAINCLIFVREHKLNRFQAAQILNAVYKDSEHDFAKAIVAVGLEHLLTTERPRLLDLLEASDLISHANADWALEIAVESQRQTGQVLLSYGLISENVLESALQLQHMLANGTLSLERGAELLRLCRDTETTLECLLIELDYLNRVVKLLRRCHLLDEEKVSAVANKTDEFETKFGSLLVQEGVVPQPLLFNAAHLLNKVEEGAVSQEDADEAMKYCHLQNCSPQEALMHISGELRLRRQSNDRGIMKSA
ncbi:MAG TPA: hypothetical protein V6C97_15170 [Oculatellaceae cyanobacterium]